MNGRIIGQLKSVYRRLKAFAALAAIATLLAPCLA